MTKTKEFKKYGKTEFEKGFSHIQQGYYYDKFKI